MEIRPRLPRFPLKTFQPHQENLTFGPTDVLNHQKGSESDRKPFDRNSVDFSHPAKEQLPPAVAVLQVQRLAKGWGLREEVPRQAVAVQGLKRRVVLRPGPRPAVWLIRPSNGGLGGWGGGGTLKLDLL